MNKYRMYCLVLKQLSPIQKGVQAAHSIVEYSNKYFNDKNYMQWSMEDKTIIELNGGTAPELYEILDMFKQNGIKHAVFREPDLMNIITSICFIADENVYDPELEYVFENPELLEVDSKLYKDYLLRKTISKMRLAY